MRKLVRLDENCWLTEVDPKALRREAEALQAYILQAPTGEAREFKYHEKLLPLIEAALDGTLPIPYKGDEPYNGRLILDGLQPNLPNNASSLYSRFLLRIKGSARLSSKSVDAEGYYIPDEVMIDGQRYEWVEFED